MRRFIHTHQIKMSSLLETRVRAPKMGALYFTICPNWCFTTNLCHTSSGRIVLDTSSGRILLEGGIQTLLRLILRL